MIEKETQTELPCCMYVYATTDDGRRLRIVCSFYQRFPTVEFWTHLRYKLIT